MRAFQQYARRTVEETWLDGDALLWIKWQLLQVPGHLLLRSAAYPQKRQLVAFDSVSGRLHSLKSASRAGPDCDPRRSGACAGLYLWASEGYATAGWLSPLGSAAAPAELSLIGAGWWLCGLRVYARF